MTKGKKKVSDPRRSLGGLYENEANWMRELRERYTGHIDIRHFLIMKNSKQTFSNISLKL